MFVKICIKQIVSTVQYIKVNCLIKSRVESQSSGTCDATNAITASLSSNFQLNISSSTRNMAR